jgi:nucleoside-diphosphate-sugar epimerase
MRVLVTGDKGYIGTVMVRVLEAAGHEVAGFDAGFFQHCVLGPAPRANGSTTGDLRDISLEDLAGFDAVVHLAALSNDPLGDLAPEHTYAINHHASVRLAGLARDAGVRRFLYSSSCSVYGTSGADAVVDERAPMRPLTPYATSKVQVEEDLHAMADDNFSPVYLRNATAYGWSPRLRCDLVLNDLVARAHLTGEVRVLSDGSPWRPIVHVEDIASAFLAALEAPRAAVHDQAFNVGRADENYQIRELAAIVGEAVPGSRIAITGETGADPRSYRVDFSKIGRHLPVWRPRHSARGGAAELHEAYVRWGLSDGEFGGRFKRLPWLTHLQAEGLLDETLRWTAPAAGSLAAASANTLHSTT